MGDWPIFSSLDDCVVALKDRAVALEKRLDEQILRIDKQIQRVDNQNIGELKKRVRELEVLLHGDPEAEETYKKNRESNSAPNIPKPKMGVLAGWNLAFEVSEQMVDGLKKRVDSFGVDLDRRLEFAKRLQAFFGPMLENKNPPLDDAAVATKAFVTEAVERIAGALRRELAEMGVRDLMRELLKSSLSEPNKDFQESAHGTSRWLMITEKLEWVWKQEYARAHKPSRVNSLIHAITGYSKQNGATR